jgi:hypothetical protein
MTGGRLVKIAASVAMVWVSVMLWGCQTQRNVRHEGVTSGAGEAVAANTVMQMVDPWPAGVEDTALATPADIEQFRRRRPEDVANSAAQGDYSDGATTQ